MTYEEIMDDAYGLSSKINPGVNATEDPELLGVINRSLDALATIAASVNPTFFGASSAVTPGGGAWAIPADAELLFYMEKDDGTEVVPVRIEEKDEVEPDHPTVYMLGPSLFSVDGADPDPGADDITIYYAQSFADGTAVGDSLPAEWDEQHNDLLVYQTGIYLAAKDIGSMGEELQVFFQQRDAALARFIRKLENRLGSLRARFGSRVVTNTNSIVNHRQLLGGALEG